MNSKWPPWRKDRLGIVVNTWHSNIRTKIDKQYKLACSSCFFNKSHISPHLPDSCEQGAVVFLWFTTKKIPFIFILRVKKHSLHLSTNCRGTDLASIIFFFFATSSVVSLFLLHIWCYGEDPELWVLQGWTFILPAVWYMNDYWLFSLELF